MFVASIGSDPWMSGDVRGGPTMAWTGQWKETTGVKDSQSSCPGPLPLPVSSEFLEAGQTTVQLWILGSAAMSYISQMAATATHADVHWRAGLWLRGYSVRLAFTPWQHTETIQSGRSQL